MTWIIIIVCFLFVFFLYGYLSHFHLVTKNYEIDTEGRTGEHTIAVLADLHNCHHGKNNEKLLNRIRESGADTILIPGDMVVKHCYTKDKKVQEVLSLLRTLCRKYAVYYSPGNHEIRMADYENYKNELEHVGVRYAENRELFFADAGIRIYGLDLPLEWYREYRPLTVSQLGIFLNKTRADQRKHFTILLAHDPRHFEAYTTWGADLTVCGHVHGGILRLPLIGGVLSPYLRLFPKYDAGMYEKDGKRMIVSRGLGSHHVKFRWFNPPELVIIRLR
ncbi:MAG: metallophosphoesterase [Eubacterium sp.]|nr:metallophosphoesterase [Eubacterium sp.]